jgi:hypothetical protein
MGRKGEDTFAMKRRQMPYVARIKRDDPFCSADKREIEAMVKRIAAAGEHFSIAGWHEEAGFLLFHFPTWAKARAMQHWIDRSGIAYPNNAFSSFARVGTSPSSTISMRTSRMRVNVANTSSLL